MPVRTLVLMHTESNGGFAIAPLESTFHRLSVALGAGEPNSVHFAYRSVAKGYPTSLPPGVPVIGLSEAGRDPADTLVEYVRTHSITFVLAFDLQPVSALFRRLRAAGVRSIVSYWGAEISSVQPIWKQLLKRTALAVSRSKVDALIFESEAMADLARLGRGVPRHMIDVVPLGIDVSRFIPDKSDYVYTRLPLSSSRKVVVYAGHMEPRKGVRFLIEAAIQLLAEERRTDVAFLLLGNRAGEEADFKAMYESLEISEHIHFAGYRNDLNQIFPSCFLGVIPSSGWDSFPRTALEFGASGLPLIVTELGGLPETIERNTTGVVVPPSNSRAIADQIRLFLDDQPLAQRMGDAGRRRCVAHFSSEIQFNRLLEILQRRTA